MAKYAVRVIETLSKTYVVDADSYEDAEEIIEDARQNGDIILDSDDYFNWEVGPSDTFDKEPIPESDERLNYFTKYEN